MITFFTYLLIVVIGVMMGTIYKRSFSNVAALQFRTASIKNVYWGAVVFGLLICSFFSVKCYYAFQEMAIAVDKAHVFEDYKNSLHFFLAFGLMTMIVIANIISFISKKIEWLFYIITFLVYGFFTVIYSFLLDKMLFDFKQINQLWKGEIYLSDVTGILSLVFAALLCLFNAYMTKWGLRK